MAPAPLKLRAWLGADARTRSPRPDHEHGRDQQGEADENRDVPEAERQAAGEDRIRDA
jgi:hypothetical protein